MRLSQPVTEPATPLAEGKIKMIAFNRVASVAPGKTAAAIAFGKEISAYMKDAYKVDLEMLVPVGGNPQRLAWSARYADLAALDAVNGKILMDKKYWEILNQNNDLFLPGSIHDSIWRTV
jgi:hypothetical protein